MTNRFLLLLSCIAISLVMIGCPAPEDETDRGFRGLTYYSVNSEIRRIDLSNGRIITIGSGTSPCITTSGNVLAVVNGTGLVEYLYGGTERRTIVQQDNTGAGEPYNDLFIDPQVSPNGQHIAYEGVGSSIFIVDRNGSYIRSVGGPAQQLKRPQWLPTGELIAQGIDDLYKINSQFELGGKIEGTSHMTQHSVSPDGKKIVAVSDNDIWIMNVDGTQPILMMNGNEEVQYPTWSSSGKHIIVKDGCDLRLFPVDGGAVASVRARFFSFDERQCPDGRQLDWQ